LGSGSIRESEGLLDYFSGMTKVVPFQNAVSRQVLPIGLSIGVMHIDDHGGPTLQVRNLTCRTLFVNTVA